MSSRRNSILDSYVSCLAFVAHEKIPWCAPQEPTHTNHWTIYLQILSERSICISWQPDYGNINESGYAAQLLVSKLDFLPDENHGYERVCWVKLAKEGLLIEGKGDDVAVQSAGATGVRVKDVVKVSEKCAVGFQFSNNRTGCRRWILKVLDALVATGLMMDGKDVDVVRRDIRKLWPDETKLDLLSIDYL